MNKVGFRHCLCQIHEGNIDAILPIYTEYYEKLKITAKKILHSDALAEDAASESMLRLIEFAGTHEHFKIDSPGAYMYCIVRNVAVTMYNYNKTYEALDDMDEERVEADRKSDESLDLENAIAALDKKDFDIAVLHYFYGYKVKHIAAELNMPEGTVKWKLMEIRHKLAKSLEK